MDRDPSTTPPPVPLDVERRPQKVRGRGPCAKSAFFPRIRLVDLARQEAERLEMMVPYAEQAIGEGRKYQFQHLFFFDWFRRFPVSTWHNRIEGMNRRCPWHSELLISTVSDLIWDHLMARVKWYHRATKRRIGRPKNMPQLECHWTRLLRNIDTSTQVHPFALIRTSTPFHHGVSDATRRAIRTPDSTSSEEDINIVLSEGR